jgi:hypothetical protein
VDVWGYADPIISDEYGDSSAWDWRVEYIWESSDGEYQHIVIPVPRNNTYLTIVVHVPSERIFGHIVLDMGALYGLTS